MSAQINGENEIIVGGSASWPVDHDFKRYSMLTTPSPSIELNTDLSQRLAISSAQLAWQPSPEPGVHRRMLARIGGEVAQATSVVRYAPGSKFARHEHGLGEEFVVLKGRFSDEHGHYEAGTYVKNPVGSAHAPYSELGCEIFVKLRHLDPLDSKRVVVNIHEATWRPGLVPGLTVLPLNEFESQHTAMVRWAPGTYFNAHRHFGGEEIFVLDGVFEDEFGRYEAGTWLRSPHVSQHKPFSKEGCTIFVKTGHLV
jgi:anti-sigma factor ChrR (cupin superfamily)